MNLSKNFYDLDAYDDDDIVQEGTETGSLDFNFDDEKPEVVEEGVFDHGFLNLRGAVADALKNTKYKVSMIIHGMLGKDMFTISDDNITTTVESMGNGCKVVTRDNQEHMKVNFNNIPLSNALRNIVDLFKNPEHILEGAIEDPYYRSIYQESDTAEPSTEDEPTLESFVQEAFDMKSEAAKMIQRPEVKQAMADGIDKRFKELYGSWVKPTEAELKENRERVWNQIKDRPEIALSMFAEKYFDELLDAQTKAMRDDSMAKLEEMKKKLMERREKNVNESFVQEDGEEEPRVDETIEEDTPVEDEKPEEPKEEDQSSDEDDKHFLSYEELDKITPEGDDLKDFGTDTSDVQNEYDPKEIEILNKLVSAEAEAINDYFDAGKDSHDSNARRLYSDIGHEERFHLEQLLFQKSKFTGEKYEPRDPEVKEEYEKLLKMGMDDETAMNTAIDKKFMEPSDDGDDSDIESLEIDFESAVTLLEQNEILMEAAQFAYDKRGNKELFNNYSIIAEAFLYQEEVINTASVPKEVKKANPITLLIKGLKTAVNGLLAATNAARNASEANRIKRKRKIEWIKKHGVTALFASGVSFYFYDDNTSTFDMTRPCQYVDMLYRLSIAIGKQCGIQPKSEAYHGTIQNPIKFNTIGDGMAKIKTLQVTKTKVVVNDNNKEALTNEFFGYNDQKINVKVWNAEANKAIYQSNNVYTKLELFGVITNQYLDITLSIMEVLEKMQGDMNSIYYKNRNLYNDASNNMKIIATTYRKLINACVSDLAEMNKFDKKVLETTRTRDTAEQTGQQWEGEDRRTSGNMAKEIKNENKYARQKK